MFGLFNHASLILISNYFIDAKTSLCFVFNMQHLCYETQWEILQKIKKGLKDLKVLVNDSKSDEG